jgi:hypothetical protein
MESDHFQHSSSSECQLIDLAVALSIVAGEVGTLDGDSIARVCYSTSRHAQPTAGAEARLEVSIGMEVMVVSPGHQTTVT